MIKYTVPALLEESFNKFPHNISLSFVGETPLTYNQLKNKIDGVSMMLENFGVSPGDKVAILSNNMPNWGIAYFAILCSGAIAVPVLPDFHPDEISKILQHAEAKLIFISENLYYKVEQGLPGKISARVLIDNFSIIPEGTSAGKLQELSPYPGNENPSPSRPAVEEDDLASIIYTSGTTGTSKGVMLTHRNISWNAIQSFTVEPIYPFDKFLSILPLSHTYENTLGLLFPVFYGASVYYLRKPPVPSVLLPALSLVQPTKLLTVPLVIEKIFRNKILPEFQKSSAIRFLYRIPFIRKMLHRIAGKKLMKTFGGKITFFGVGGSKLDGRVERFLLEAKFPYAIGYGLTETSPLLAGTNPRTPRVGSTGPAIKGVRLRLGDVDPATGEGEIQATGPNVMNGYYKNPEMTKNVFTADGWFRTGDLGSFDKDGFLRIKGRIKNMIVGASGENIYPEEIESLINRMRYVIESLVVEKKGKLVALIHLNMDEIEHQFQAWKQDAVVYAEKINLRKDEILKDIQETVNAQVNKFSRIQQVLFHKDPFEKTPTQKIKRFLYHQNN